MQKVKFALQGFVLYHTGMYSNINGAVEKSYALPCVAHHNAELP